MTKVIVLAVLWVGILAGFLLSHTPEGRGLFAMLVGFFSVALVHSVTTLKKNSI